MNMFSFARTPLLYFGPDAINYLPEIIEQWGQRILLITGKGSFEHAPWKEKVTQSLKKFSVVHIAHSGEPTVEVVNECLDNLRPQTFDCIVSIGGGSIIDLGKAISAMLTVNDPIEFYLEGLPDFRPHPGTKIPFIAVPTTAGTGSEVTKNAVISKFGENGFKRSLRHNNFVPDAAIIDPILHVSCPPHVTAASGLDALTQLIESYLSPQANLLTDILAEKGIELAAQSLIKVYNEPSDIEQRVKMAMAAYLSGLTLAHAGLGAVHGFASSIGGLYKASHGAICGCLLAKTLEVNLKKIINYPDIPLKNKIRRLSYLLQPDLPSQSIEKDVDIIINQISTWAWEMKIPTLRQLGVEINDIDKIAAQTQIKNNPVPLDKNELRDILMASW